MYVQKFIYMKYINCKNDCSIILLKSIHQAIYLDLKIEDKGISPRIVLQFESEGKKEIRKIEKHKPTYIDS